MSCVKAKSPAGSSSLRRAGGGLDSEPDELGVSSSAASALPNDHHLALPWNDRCAQNMRAMQSRKYRCSLSWVVDQYEVVPTYCPS